MGSLTTVVCSSLQLCDVSGCTGGCAFISISESTAAEFNAAFRGSIRWSRGVGGAFLNLEINCDTLVLVDVGGIVDLGCLFFFFFFLRLDFFTTTLWTPIGVGSFCWTIFVCCCLRFIRVAGGRPVAAAAVVFFCC